jgi:hypothetical protein
MLLSPLVRIRMRCWVGEAHRPAPACPGRLLAALFVLAATLVSAAPASAFVYWNSAKGAIGRASLNGTGVDRSFINGAKGKFDVEVNAAHIYWTTDVGIGRARLDGTHVNKRFITGADFPNTPNGVAVNATHVYWASYASGTIGRARLDGTGVNQSFITARDPTELAVNAARVYWSTGGGVGRARLDGTGVDESFITGARRCCSGVAVHAAHVYWAGGGIGRANLNGTGVDQRFIDPRAAEVAVGAAHVYWTGGGIGRARLNGTGIDRSFIKNGAHGGLAVDACRPRGCR